MNQYFDINPGITEDFEELQKRTDRMLLREQAQGLTTEEMVGLRLSSVKWSITQLKRASSFLVYVFWNDAGIALYVGRSTKGITRPLSPSHQQAQKAILESTSIEYFICQDFEEMEILELRMIRTLNPLFNKRR